AGLSRGHHLAAGIFRRALGSAACAFLRTRTRRARLLYRTDNGSAELAPAARYRAPRDSARHDRLARTWFRLAGRSRGQQSIAGLLGWRITQRLARQQDLTDERVQEGDRQLRALHVSVVTEPGQRARRNTQLRQLLIGVHRIELAAGKDRRRPRPAEQVRHIGRADREGSGIGGQLPLPVLLAQSGV